MVNSPRGSIFLKFMDVLDVSKDANFLFGIVDKMVDEVGEENVVQVVTDNASAYVKAWKMLEATSKNLYWTPCAAHCIDHMLEDIGKQIPQVKSCPQSQDFLHITLLQFHKQKNNLRKMVTSQEWTDCKWSKESKGRTLQSTILQEGFWRNIVYALKLMDPLIKVLKLVDGERKSAMGYIYEPMNKAKEAINRTEWWSIFGSSSSNLQKFAIQVLSLTCSATSCERNWGVFQHKRNRLAQERLNDMVYVKFNRALQHRYKKEGSGDHIILEDIDESNEWLMGMMDNNDGDEDDDLVFLDGDLTWGDVSRASRAYEIPHFTRTSRGRVNDDGQDEVEVEADIADFDSDKRDAPVLGFDDDSVGSIRWSLVGHLFRL
ncbi:hypothetical protein OSB04_002415 [Centaurea solstitialis]|uniref:Uncharacterized protein n=1 Tax=Centaurea solstitialis TaxID=347529 RepID=A0AA38WUV0_9ASTR|nr:hypothetical protein OSB04_002415 [Centaurea solstitialis]